MIETRHARCWFWIGDNETKAKTAACPRRRRRGKHESLLLEFALMLVLTWLLPRGRK